MLSASLTGPGTGEAAQRLAQALAQVGLSGQWQHQTLSPATEARLRQHLGAQPCDVLHLLVEAQAVGAAYATVSFEDSRGAPRKLNAQALGQMLAQATPAPSLVLLLAPEGRAEAHAAVGAALRAKGVAAVVSGEFGRSSGGPALLALHQSLAQGGSAGDALQAARQAGADWVLQGQAAPVRAVTMPAAVPAPQAVAAAIVAASAPAPDPIAAALAAKRAAGRFDVFLCHNSADKPAVKLIGQRLKARGVLPWLDEWELPPGQPWQALLERQIESIASAAVFIGAAGISPWHQQEMRGFISAFVDRQSPVIPVLLPDAPAKPELPIFLRQFTWVDFRQSDPDPFQRLLWGVTGQRDDGP